MPIGLPCSAEGQPERPRAAGVLLPSPLAAPKEVAWGAQVLARLRPHHVRRMSDTLVTIELPATPQEAASLVRDAVAKQGAPAALVVTEDRSRPVGMFDELPMAWAARNERLLEEVERLLHVRKAVLMLQRVWQELTRPLWARPSVLIFLILAPLVVELISRRCLSILFLRYNSKINRAMAFLFCLEKSVCSNSTQCFGDLVMGQGRLPIQGSPNDLGMLPRATVSGHAVRNCTRACCCAQLHPSMPHASIRACCTQQYPSMPCATVSEHAMRK